MISGKHIKKVVAGLFWKSEKGVGKVYDHAGRLLQTWHSLKGATPVLLVANNYNEIGQLVTKSLYKSGSTFKQNVDYAYNIRGWLTRINDSDLSSAGNQAENGNSALPDLFGMNLLYEQQDAGLNNTQQYNGNISAVKWSNNLSLGTTKNFAYNYGYDTLNRIKSADHLCNPGVWTASTKFAENGFKYDLNGNIQTLTRNGANGTVIDNLTYTRNGNQLLTITDAADKTKGLVDNNSSGNDFSFDANGNMSLDKNKNITAMTYNYLNLPLQVTKNTGEKIIYVYNAHGERLSQQLYNASGTLTKTTDYVGEFIYQNDTLQFIDHDEGRVVMKGVTNPEYQYFLKDNLGNIRVTFTTQTTTKTYTAGFETANQTTEAANFLNYPSGSHINTVASNAHTGSNSLYLNGAASGQVGVAKSYSVMPGDVVSIQAYAKYLAPTNTPSNIAGFATALLSAFNLTAPVGGETGTARSAINSWGAGEAAAFGDGTTDQTDPKVFVTIIIFDRNYTLLDVAFQQLTSSGVMNATYTVKQPGYAYMYVSNEQPYQTDVYIDDVTVTFAPSAVEEITDYYPGGAIAVSYQRDQYVPNHFKYQDKEYQDDLGLNLYDFEGRQYAPWGQFTTTIDPHAEHYYSWSPYSWAFDNPVSFIDPDGQDPIDRITSTQQTVKVNSITANRDSDGNITSVNIKFTLTTTNVIETTHDDGMVSTRTESTTSKESATFSAQSGVGTSQKDGDFNLGAPLSNIYVPGGKDGTKTTTQNSNSTSSNEKDKSKTENVKTKSTLLLSGPASQIGAARDKYVKENQKTVWDKYWGFVLSPNSEPRRNRLNTVTNDREHRESRLQRMGRERSRKIDSVLKIPKQP
jgi:RHS repeat-associated protein